MELLTDFWDYLASNALQLISAGMAGSLVTMLLSHYLAKSRSKESFDRGVKHEETKDEKTARMQLGLFADGFRNCAERGSEHSARCGAGPPSRALTDFREIEFGDYAEIKRELVRLRVFAAKEWAQFDKMKDRIADINRSLQIRPRAEAQIECFHFTQFSMNLWSLAVEEYRKRDGQLEELTTVWLLQPPLDFTSSGPREEAGRGGEKELNDTAPYVYPVKPKTPPGGWAALGHVHSDGAYYAMQYPKQVLEEEREQATVGPLAVVGPFHLECGSGMELRERRERSDGKILWNCPRCQKDIDGGNGLESGLQTALDEARELFEARRALWLQRGGDL